MLFTIAVGLDHLPLVHSQRSGAGTRNNSTARRREQRHHQASVTMPDAASQQPPCSNMVRMLSPELFCLSKNEACDPAGTDSSAVVKNVQTVYNKTSYFNRANYSSPSSLISHHVLPTLPSFNEDASCDTLHTGCISHTQTAMLSTDKVKARYAR